MPEPTGREAVDRTASVADVCTEGTTAMVVGNADARRSFALDRLAGASAAAAVMAPAEPAATVADRLDARDASAPLVVVSDGATDESTPELASVDLPDRAVASVGEATLDALDGRWSEPSDRLWLAAGPRGLDDASVQDCYRLFYVVAQRARERGAVALLSVGPGMDAKQRRILGQPLDYEVMLTDGDPTVRRLDTGSVSGGE